MTVPVRAIAEIGKKAAIPLTAAIAALGGFILGGLVRQPEVNDLKHQVKQLKKQQERFVQVVDAQNEEIRDLLDRYHALKVHQVLQRSEMKKLLQDSLVFQYATADYLELMISRIESGEDPSETEGAFYCAFSNMLAGKALSEDEMAAVKSYVMPRHKEEIASLTPCDTDSALEALLQFGESKKKGFEFPKVELPEIPLPRFGKKNEGDTL